MKIAAIFVFSLVNATWALIAYLLHISGVAARVLVIVVAVGILLGNVTVYGGLKLTQKVLPKTRTLN